jgi:hypothetical protein
MREYAVRRGWRIALQVREVNSGAAKRVARERLLEAARRREIDVVLVWRLDRWGRSVSDLLATLTEALDLITPAGRAMAGLLAIFAEFEREVLRNGPGLVWLMRGRTASDWADLQPQPFTLRKSGNCAAPASANPKLAADWRLDAPPFAGSWQAILPP